MTDCTDRPTVDHRSDRREWGRFVADVGEIVLCSDGGKASTGQVLDESFGGIGLAVEPPLDIDVGTPIDVTYEGIPLRGIVRNISHASACGQRLGIEWSGTVPGDGRQPGHRTVDRCLLVLFRMWEAGQWRDLTRAAQQLVTDARSAGWGDLTRRAESLALAAADPPNAAAIRTSLAALVDLCTCETV